MNGAAATSPRDEAPIADYALISDCQGSALVSRDGSIDWACLARFDAPSVFAGLLGAGAGHWRIGPGHPVAVEREYLLNTMVLRTTFGTAGGVVAVTDALSLGPDEQGHEIGAGSPHVLVRRVDGVEGSVRVEFELAPRPEYGLTAPLLAPDGSGFRTRGGSRSYVLSTGTPVRVIGSDCTATFNVAAGDTLYFAFALGSPWDDDTPRQLSQSEIAELLDRTIAAWRSWSALHQAYDGPYAELVRHSGRVLQALSYAPTGAIVAAPTTSLPETPGGPRNWDYRFCWVRDASLTLEALWVAACPDEAEKFFQFLVTAAGGHLRSSGTLQILYGVGGERLVPEHELEHLDGYRGSHPVRIGNEAWNQAQLDVYGELLSAACLLATTIGSFDEITAAFLIDVANAAATQWPLPDQGIWEVRGPPRHFLHSKLMCWVALDRAILLAPLLGAEEHISRWTDTRQGIRDAIENRGWNDAVGAFTQSFDSDALDASTLMLLLTGFLPPDDPRIRATVDAIADRLTDDRGFVYRYLAPDGLDGAEGTFAICTFWLVECLATLGETRRARSLFEQLTSFANDVGLMSEETDSSTGELLGNFPQAFTHIGLVNAAWAIAQAEGSAAPDTGPTRDGVR